MDYDLAGGTPQILPPKHNPINISKYSNTLGGVREEKQIN